SSPDSGLRERWSSGAVTAQHKRGTGLVAGASAGQAGPGAVVVARAGPAGIVLALAAPGKPRGAGDARRQQAGAGVDSPRTRSLAQAARPGRGGRRPG